MVCPQRPSYMVLLDSVRAGRLSTQEMNKSVFRSYWCQPKVLMAPCVMKEKGLAQKLGVLRIFFSYIFEGYNPFLTYLASLQKWFSLDCLGGGGGWLVKHQIQDGGQINLSWKKPLPSTEILILPHPHPFRNHGKKEIRENLREGCYLRRWERRPG